MDYILPTLDCLASSYKIMNDYKTNNALVVYLTDYEVNCLPYI